MAQIYQHLNNFKRENKKKYSPHLQKSHIPIYKTILYVVIKATTYKQDLQLFEYHNIGTTMKKLMLLSIFGLVTNSNNALAEETKTLTFPKIKSQIEIPTNCNIEKSTKQKKVKVKCTDPQITAAYHEGEYTGLKSAIVKMHKEGKKIFEDKGFKVLGVQEL